MITTHKTQQNERAMLAMRGGVSLGIAWGRHEVLGLGESSRTRNRLDVSPRELQRSTAVAEMMGALGDCSQSVLTSDSEEKPCRSPGADGRLGKGVLEHCGHIYGSARSCDGRTKCKQTYCLVDIRHREVVRKICRRLGERRCILNDV